MGKHNALPEYMNTPHVQDTQPLKPISSPKYRLRRIALIALIVFGFVAVVSVVVVLQWMHTTPVIWSVDGIAVTLETRADTVREFLLEQGVYPSPNDRLTPGLDTPIEANQSIRLDRAQLVQVTINQQSQHVYSVQPQPNAILDQLGITLNPFDEVWIDGQQVSHAQLADWSAPLRQIEIRPAIEVTIVQRGNAQTLLTTARTVGDALFEAQIPLYLADSVSIDLSTPLTAGMEIQIQPAYQITIEADGQALQSRVQGTTVANALSSMGVVLAGLDYTIPSESTALRDGMTVRVLRVREEVITSDETLPFERVVQGNPELELDTERIAQSGQVGIRRTTTRIRYENGIEVSQQTEASAVIQDPRNEIFEYGMNVVVRTLDTPNGPVEYWRVLRMYATSYHPAALGGDNITATGATLQHGIVGSDPRVLPYGTRIYVRNYGIGDIQDTGGPRRIPLWVDLGYSDHDWRSWSGYVDVYILTPVPASIDYIVP